jgi:uncharacterized membrane protein
MDETQKVLIALSYPIWIVALITAIIEKKDKQVKFHAYQALFFNVGFFILCIVLWIAIFVLTMISFGILGFLFLLLWPVYIVWLVLAIVYAVKAYHGEKFKVPIVHKFAYNIAYK